MAQDPLAMFSLLHYDRQRERYSFICDHGQHRLTATTDNAKDAADAFSQLLREHHAKTGCHCRPGEWLERWDRLADAIAQHEYDTAHPEPADSPLAHFTPKIAGMLERLQALGGCGTCEPGVTQFIDLRLGAVGAAEPSLSNMILIHTAACPRYESPLYAVDGIRQQIGAVTLLLS